MLTDLTPGWKDFCDGYKILATSDHLSGMDATLINMPDQENVSEVAQLWKNEKYLNLVISNDDRFSLTFLF